MGLATHIVVSKVHFWVIWDSYWLILWCQKTHIDSYCGVKSPFLSDLRLILWCQKTHIDSYCGVKSPFLSDLRLILWCQKSISEWFENPVNLGLKKELGLTPPRPVWTMSPFFTVFFPWELPLVLSIKVSNWPPRALKLLLYVRCILYLGILSEYWPPLVITDHKASIIFNHSLWSLFLHWLTCQLKVNAFICLQ